MSADIDERWAPKLHKEELSELQKQIRLTIKFSDLITDCAFETPTLKSV